MADFELRWMRQQLSPQQRAAYLRGLTPVELDRYESAGGAAETFLAGRGLLRELVSELTGLPADGVRITATCQDCGGPHGRPTLDGSSLHLGLSRCASAVVAVASWHGPIGVDVEQTPGTPDAIAAIGELTGIADLRHWTRVEAVLKADGRGLRVDPSAVTALGSEAQVEGSNLRYRLHEPEIDPGLLVTVATAG